MGLSALIAYRAASSFTSPVQRPMDGNARSAGPVALSRQLFARYAGVSLVAVVLLGLVLAASYRTEAAQRGLAQGRSEAALVAQTAVEPVLDGRPLSAGLSRFGTRRTRAARRPIGGQS